MVAWCGRRLEVEKMVDVLLGVGVDVLLKFV